MYLGKVESYWNNTEQFIKRGRFLILVQPKGNAESEIRALVRKVALRQFGHWMMGKARCFGHTITISGTYGNDGLIRDVPEEVYQRATPVPEYIIELWNKGGGWNGPGTERREMFNWANRTFPVKSF